MDNSKLKEHFIFGEHLIDEKAKEQFFSCLAADYSLRGALMADAHMGYSLPIGGVMWTENVVVPAYIGYDIGCGMQAVQTSFRPGPMGFHAPGIYKMLDRAIPTGFKHHTASSKQAELDDWVFDMASSTFCEIYHNLDADRQLGTMGGNNHYIEVGIDKRDRVCFVVHSGSRGLGHKVATHYMKVAGGGKAKEGNYPLMFDTKVGQEYWRDMNACLEFAQLNRYTLLMMVEDTLLRMGFSGEVHWDTVIDTVHNYGEFITSTNHQVMHRKGATKISDRDYSIVAGNPVAGTFIVRGNPNRPTSLDSVSHGMGRTGSRKQANQTITDEMVAEQMGDVVGKIKREEAPAAYKSVGDVMDAQADLLTIENQIKPVLCLKG
jgi:tRNA-splicing ligase RtcB